MKIKLRHKRLTCTDQVSIDNRLQYIFIEKEKKG